MINFQNDQILGQGILDLEIPWVVMEGCNLRMHPVEVKWRESVGVCCETWRSLFTA